VPEGVQRGKALSGGGPGASHLVLSLLLTKEKRELKGDEVNHNTVPFFLLEEGDRG